MRRQEVSLPPRAVTVDGVPLETPERDGRQVDPHLSADPAEDRRCDLIDEVRSLRTHEAVMRPAIGNPVRR
jgi:hypothetical protein